MNEPNESLMTLRQAEVWLLLQPSARGRRLKRILLGLERSTRREIITRLGSQGMRVTRSALRRYCRHLIPSHVDELRERFAQFLHGVDEQIETRVAEHVAEHVEPQLEELWQRDEVQARAIKELSLRVKRIADQPRRVDAKGREGTPLSHQSERAPRVPVLWVRK